VWINEVARCAMPDAGSRVTKEKGKLTDGAFQWFPHTMASVSFSIMLDWYLLGRLRRSPFGYTVILDNPKALCEKLCRIRTKIQLDLAHGSFVGLIYAGS
jgi:hypothetical protein